MTRNIFVSQYIQRENLQSVTYKFSVLNKSFAFMIAENPSKIHRADGCERRDMFTKGLS